MATSKLIKEEKPESLGAVNVDILPSGPRWVKVTKEQLMKLQADARLIGYNPETSEALIK